MIYQIRSMALDKHNIQEVMTSRSYRTYSTFFRDKLLIFALLRESSALAHHYSSQRQMIITIELVHLDTHVTQTEETRKEINLLGKHLLRG